MKETLHLHENPEQCATGSLQAEHNLFSSPTQGLVRRMGIYVLGNIFVGLFKSLVLTRSDD